MGTIRQICASAVVAAAISVAAFVGTVATASVASAQQSGDIVPGRFIVTFKLGGASASSIAGALAGAHGFGVRHVYSGSVRGMSVQMPAGANVAGILNALRNNPNVAAVGNDRYAVAVGEMTLGLDRINATPLTAANTGTGVRVAVVDTGLKLTHGDLAGNIDQTDSVTCTGGADSLPNSPFLGTCSVGGNDDNGHGSFVGGIIAAEDNGTDIVGVAPKAELIAVKVLDANGSGPFGDIIAGLQHIENLADHVDVVNMSLAATCSVCTDNSSDLAVQAFHAAVQSLVSSGTTVVVASSNEALDAQTSVPAAFDEVITVSALTDTDGAPGGNGSALVFIGAGRYKDDNFAKFSNYGADVDVIAPGVNVTSLSHTGGTKTGSGTSFAAPYAAGVAALFLSDNPTASPATVREALIQTGECRDGNDGNTFYGDANGCSQIWPGDKDNIAEPMVRADNVLNYVPSGPVHDVAVSSVTAPAIALNGALQNITVNIANQGTETETVDVTLTDNGGAVDGTKQIILAAGDNGGVDFSWMSSGLGNHLLVASAAQVAGESDLADNEKSTNVEVMDPLVDVAVNTVTALDPVYTDTVVDIAVDVENLGTQEATFNVSLTVAEGATSGSQGVTLAAGAGTSLSFTWDTAGLSGSHDLTASSDLVGDTVGGNNSMTTTVTVATAPNYTLALSSRANNMGRTWETYVTVDLAGGEVPTIAGTHLLTGTWTIPTEGTITVECDISGGSCELLLYNIRKKIGSVSFKVDSVTGAENMDVTDATINVLKP